MQYHIGMGTEGPNATDDKQFCDEHGITYESFSPLCGPCGKDAHMELITGKMVTDIGKKYGKSGAQVSLNGKSNRESLSFQGQIRLIIYWKILIYLIGNYLKKI